MCMEDVRLARQTGPPDVSLPSVGAPGTLVVKQQAKRYAIIISNPSANIVYISPLSTVTVGNGIPIPSRGDPVVLDLQHHGALVTGAWYADASAYPSVVAVVETLLENE